MLPYTDVVLELYWNWNCFQNSKCTLLLTGFLFFSFRLANRLLYLVLVEKFLACSVAIFICRRSTQQRPWLNEMVSRNFHQSQKRNSGYKDHRLPHTSIVINLQHLFAKCHYTQLPTEVLSLLHRTLGMFYCTQAPPSPSQELELNRNFPSYISEESVAIGKLWHLIPSSFPTFSLSQPLLFYLQLRYVEHSMDDNSDSGNGWCQN